MNTFERDGVRFQHPANWTVEVEDGEDGGWTVSVHSPEFAFLVASLRPEATDPTEVAEQALAAFREVYQELDAEMVVEPFAGLPAIGHNLDFLTADTAVVCRTRCIDTPAGPLLVTAQASEFDRGRTEPVLDAIFASFRIEDE